MIRESETPVDLGVDIHRNLLLGASLSFLTEQISPERTDLNRDRITEAVLISLHSGDERI